MRRFFNSQGTRHAELVAIDSIIINKDKQPEFPSFASCDVYVTCEPCIMCAAALSLMSFRSVVYGCPNDKFGGNGSVLSIHRMGCGTCGGYQNRSSGSSCQTMYSTRGGLLSEDAIKLLQVFYISGNPNGKCCFPKLNLVVRFLHGQMR